MRAALGLSLAMTLVAASAQAHMIGPKLAAAVDAAIEIQPYG